MKVAIHETSSTVRTLEVSLPQQAIQSAFEKKVTEYRREIHMKGFRPGMVPRNIVIQRFGEVIRSEAVDATINELVRTELDKAGIKPVAPGRVEDFKDDRQNDISFRVIVEVDPPVVVQGYKDTGVRVPEVVINAAEISDELTHLQRMYAEHKPVERPARQGDFVEGTYIQVMIDGEERELPQNPDFRVIIGDSSTPGFDEGLVGAVAGAEKEILFTYPADHKDEAYRGKTARFLVRITGVQEIILPELDDAFAAKLGMNSLEELRGKIEESLLERKKQQAKAKAQEEALDILIARNPFDVPEARVRQWVARTVKKMSGKKEEDDESEPEVTPEMLNALRPQAERELRKYRILESIIEQEKLKPTQEEVDQRIRDMAQSYGVDFDSIKNYMRQSGKILEIREELKFQKALDLIVGA